MMTVSKGKYRLVLNGEIIGTSDLEYGDPPMGVVFGKIIGDISYQKVKRLCEDFKIEIVYDSCEDKFVATSTIEHLRVISLNGIEIKGLGNQIAGMDSEEFEISIIGINNSLYLTEFPNHIAEYEKL